MLSSLSVNMKNRDDICSVAGSTQINKVVPLLQSDSDDSDSENIPPRKKYESQPWVFVQKFENMDQVENALNLEKTWSIHFSNNTDEGRKMFYRCNKVKKRGPQCSAKMCLLYDCLSDAVFMYRTEKDHDHNSLETSERGLSQRVKREVDKLLGLHLKPKLIMSALSKIEGLKVPKMTQLNNYLSARRKSLYGNHTISLGELEKWLKENSTLPEDPHSAFVIGYTISEDNATFRFVFSSKYLLGLARDVNILHVDATYKLIWQGYPVLIVGTTDKKRKFHPLCLTVSTTEQKEDFKFVFKSMKDKIRFLFNTLFNPEILVADAAKSIQNAFKEEFENTTIRMCWAHAKRHMQSKVETYVTKSVQNQILDDIDTLHSITNKDSFNKGTELFLKKYVNERRFIDYFQDQWLVQNRNWYLGAAPASPSTNNALEAFNKVIKDSNTFRERLQLSRFLFLAKEIVHGWSIKYAYNADTHFIAKYPAVSLKEWTDSYNWAKLKKEIEITCFDNRNLTIYQVPAGEANKCFKFEEPPSNFDEFKEYIFNSYTVTLPTNKEKWINGTCDCPYFYKMYVCKHLIGLSIRLKYAVPPVEAKNIPLGQKRKRGRPSKAKPALIIQ